MRRYTAGVVLLARNHKESDRIVDHFPIWIYAVAIIFQVVVLPPIAYMAWHSKGFSGGA